MVFSGRDTVGEMAGWRETATGPVFLLLRVCFLEGVACTYDMLCAYWREDTVFIREVGVVHEVAGT